MNGAHIPIERRFASNTDEKLRDPEYLAILGSQKRGTFHWKDLDEYRCVRLCSRLFSVNAT